MVVFSRSNISFREDIREYKMELYALQEGSSYVSIWKTRVIEKESRTWPAKATTKHRTGAHLWSPLKVSVSPDNA